MRLVDKRVAPSIGEPVKVRDLSGRGYGGAVLMWYGYATEAIYIVIGTVLIASVFGILVYQ
jgi:hypothetical protein